MTAIAERPELGRDQLGRDQLGRDQLGRDQLGRDRRQAGAEVVGKRSRWRAWRWLALAVFLPFLAVEIDLLAPYVARAAGAVRDPNPWWLAVAVVAEMVSMAAAARMQRRMLSAGGARVPVCRMVALTYAANAVSATLPGGTALAGGYVFRRLRSWGATVPAASFTVLASGVLSTISFAALAVIVAVLAGGGGLSSVLLLAAVALVIVAGLLVRARHHQDLARLLSRALSSALSRGNRILHRAPDTGIAAVQRFARELAALRPRTRDWLAGFGFAGLNWVADLACLVASCRAVGASGSTLVLVTVAYVAGMGASTVSLLPGGFGVVDAAMIFALTSGGLSTVSATAAVLLYRLISFALVVAVGWLVWAGAWFAERRRSGPQPDTAAVAAA